MRSAVAYALRCFSILVIAGCVLASVLALHDGNFELLAASVGGIVASGILWMLTEIAELLSPHEKKDAATSAAPPSASGPQ